MPTVYRRITGGQWDSTLGGPDVQVEIYAVDATDMVPNEWNASMAKDLPDVPKKGEAHPDRPELFCQSVRIDPTGPYSAEAICVFSAPSGSVLYTPKEFYRVSWRGGSETVFQMVGVDGELIGSIYYMTDPATIQNKEYAYVKKEGATPEVITMPWVDDSGQIGANIETGALYCSVSLPVFEPTNPLYVPATIDLFNSLQNNVNIGPMKIGHMTAPAGWVKYLAFDADENGSLPNMYSITHHFRVGIKRYQVDSYNGSLYQDEILTLRWKRTEPAWWAGLPADVDPMVKWNELKPMWDKELAEPVIQKICDRVNLSVLLPESLHP